MCDMPGRGDYLRTDEENERMYREENILDEVDMLTKRVKAIDAILTKRVEAIDEMLTERVNAIDDHSDKLTEMVKKLTTKVNDLTKIIAKMGTLNG